MIDIFTVVMNSRRMRRFMAVYALAYFVLCLALNYASRFFTGIIFSYLFLIVSNALQAPFIFGCVRGIVTRDYRFGKGMAAYGESDKYPFYLAYVAINMAYEVMSGLISLLTKAGGSVATLGTVLLYLMIIVRVALNFLVVGVYLHAIYSNTDRPVFSAKDIFAKFYDAIRNNLGRVIFAEAFMLVTGYLALYVAALLAELLPTASLTTYILTCLTSVQFGFIILTWPIYYLYNRETYGITDDKQ